MKISDKTETEFRMELLRRAMIKKGNMGEAIDSALKNWIKRDVWVNDIPAENVKSYIELMFTENPKLEYFSSLPQTENREGYVGMYYRLRKGETT